MVAVEGLRQRFFERRAFGIADDHAHPREGLEHRPMRAGCRKQCDNQKQVAEPDKHNGTFESSPLKVKSLMP